MRTIHFTGREASANDIAHQLARRQYPRGLARREQRRASWVPRMVRFQLERRRGESGGD